MANSDYWGAPPLHQNPQFPYHPSLQLEHHYDDGRLYQPGPSASGSVPDRSAQPSSFDNGASYTAPFSSNNFTFGQEGNTLNNAFNQFTTPNQTQFTGNQYNSSYTSTSPQAHGIQQPSLYPFPQQAQLDNSMDTSTTFASSPPSMPYQSSHIQPPVLNMQDVMPSSNHSSSYKRRKEEIEVETDDDEQDDQQAEQEPEEQKRPPGACARCKSLKVKCEFKINPNICKRCLNGNHECVIPGRKKRRAPPKREHLLNKIRDQHAEIEKLMKELEAANSRTRGRSGASDSFSLSLGSPSASSPHLALTSDTEGVTSPEESGPTRPDVAAWIARAKESMEQFSGIIGGAALANSAVFEDDEDELENLVEEDEGDERGDGNDDFAVDIVEPDIEDDEQHDGRSIRALSQSSQAGSTQTKTRKVSQSNLTNLPTEVAPYGLFAKMAIESGRMSRGGSVDPDGEEQSYGVLAPTYFVRKEESLSDENSSKPFHQQPHILTRGIVTPQEVEKLFAIYFDYMNPSCSLLDRVLYTAQNTYWRSPFLFTVICAIASRYYTERSGLYEGLMNYAQLAAGTALISGPKSIDAVAAYILLSLYPMPMRRWEDDRTWLYLGMAIRFATDLNLNRPSSAKPKNEHEARELLNRTRIWINCYNLDRSTSSWLGKSSTIHNNDYVAHHCDNWFNSSEHNLANFDVQLVAYNAELRVMGEFRATIYGNKDHPAGLKKDFDVDMLASEYDEKLSNLLNLWSDRCEKETDPNDSVGQFRNVLIRLGYGYGRLIVLSFGFQHAFGKGIKNENPYFRRCMKAASDIVRVFTENLSKYKIYLRYGVEAQSVFATFASTFLIKLLHPKYASFLNRDDRVEIHRILRDLIELLSSPEIIVDDRHGPKLWSRFLQGMLETPMARIDIPPNLLKQSSRRSAKKSSRTTSQTSQHDVNRDGVSNHSSPSSRYSVSPPPVQLTFSSMDGMPATAQMSQDSGFPPVVPNAQVSPNALQMNFDYFSGPLGFDSDLIQSMQSMEDTSIWQNSTIPGFNFLEVLQQQQQQQPQPETNDDLIGYFSSQMMNAQPTQYVGTTH